MCVCVGGGGGGGIGEGRGGGGAGGVAGINCSLGYESNKSNIVLK